MMETTGVDETVGITTTKVLDNGKHFKAGVIDLIAGSLGKLKHQRIYHQNSSETFLQS